MALDVACAVCAEAAPAVPATATTSPERHTNGRSMVISLRAGLVSVIVADDRSGIKAWRDERLAQGSRYVRAVAARPGRRDTQVPLSFFAAHDRKRVHPDGRARRAARARGAGASRLCCAWRKCNLAK